MADRKRPKGFQIFQDKKPPRKWRCYHRATGAAIDLDRFPLYTLEFYGECFRIAELNKKAADAKPGSLGMLIKQYRASRQFLDLLPRTQIDYQKCFDYLRKIEDTPLVSFTSSLIVRIRDKAGDTKGRRFGNYIRSVLSLLFAWGRERGFMKDNPAASIKGIRKPKGAPEANHPWSDAEREAVLAALPPRMLPAIPLIMFYGLDPQDALKLPRTAVQGQVIDTRRGETGVAVMVPLVEPVRTALQAAPEHNAITLCANSYGKPWTVSGFRASWRPIRQKLEEAGAVQPALTLKGLRHTAATVLREMGADYASIADMLGQKTEVMAKHYSQRADMSKKNTATVTALSAEMNRRKTKVVKPTS